MQISNAIVHGIIKEANSNNVEKKYAKATLDIDEKLKNLGIGVLGVYGKSVNNYGSFDNDRETYRFPALFEDFINGKITFADFTVRTSNLIADRMRESQLATGGFPLFLRYTNQNRDWLIIAMLKLKEATGIDFNTLQLTESTAFDIGHLHEAARVDIEKWRCNDKSYLSFVKRAGRQDEVTRYFRAALGCTTYVDAKSHTNLAIKAMNDFYKERGIDPERQQQGKQAAYDYYEEQAKKNEPVHIVALSARLFSEEPMAFADFIREKEYHINETFSPHPPTFKRLKRISGKAGNISVSFEVDDLLSDRIAYDSKNNSLIVRNIPQKLRNEIMAATGNENSEN